MPRRSAAQLVTDISQSSNVRSVKEVTKFATELMDVHGLTQHNWKFVLDKASRRAGCCNFTKKTISVATAFAMKVNHRELQDTILHEIAHALAGKKHNHDAVWKEIATKIGCTAERCHTTTFMQSKFMLTCVNNCFQGQRMRSVAAKILLYKQCKKCNGQLLSYALN